MQTGILPEDYDTPHADSGMSVGDLAALLEFGGGTIPARMLLRKWEQQHGPRIAKLIQREVATQIRTGEPLEAPLHAIAKEAERSLRATVFGGHVQPENAPSTLKKKAPETRPLIGVTKQLVNTLRAKLVRRT